MDLKKHEQIETYIRGEIEEGILVPGDQIPTELELAEQFKTSRPTVRQALELLRMEGYLVRRKGKGTFVSRPKQKHESTSFVSGYKKECEKKNQQLITRVISMRTEKADDEVAHKLGLVPGQKVVCLTRLRKIRSSVAGAREKPVLYTTVYVPYQSFEFILNVDFEQKSFYETLEEHGKKVTHASRCLEVCAPEQEIRNALQLGAFEPAIFISSVGKTALEETVEYSVSYYPASNSQFLIEVDK